MKSSAYAAALILALATPLAAQDAEGDATAGETQFSRQCTACHAVADEEGNVIAGSRGGVGPNLHGIIGAAPGSQEGYDDYSASLVAYGKTGAAWEQANFVAFLQNPTGHLREALDDPRARSKMSYRLRDEEHAVDIFAYLATFSDEEGAEGAADASE